MVERDGRCARGCLISDSTTACSIDRIIKGRASHDVQVQVRQLATWAVLANRLVVVAFVRCTALMLGANRSRRRVNVAGGKYGTEPD